MMGISALTIIITIKILKILKNVEGLKFSERIKLEIK
jgi:hypothetical protein